MATESATAAQIQFHNDRLYCFPLGGQNELGQAMWVVLYGDRILLVDAGAAYPPQDLPGVDLVFPNLSFLESRKDAIEALLLTNGHEEHIGAVAYVLQHLNVPVIKAPEFVLSLIKQTAGAESSAAATVRAATDAPAAGRATRYDTIDMHTHYEIGPFTVEWVRVNDAIADAFALYITTPAGNVFYTSSFKLDQTPVDGQLLDLGRVAQIGEEGLTLLISDSSGVERPGYTPSERSVLAGLTRELSCAPARVFIMLPGTNTHRLQLIFDIALQLGRKVILYGESLVHTAVAAVAAGNLKYDRKIESNLQQLNNLPDDKVLVVATGAYGDPMELLTEFAADLNSDFTVKAGDTIIYSAGISMGSSRAMAVLLDAFLSRGVYVKYGAAHNIHVSKHAGLEELKLMLTVAKPKFFLPALGEGRHIAHHAKTAIDWGMPPQSVFCLRNGDVLEVAGSAAASVAGSVDAAPVFYNRDQDERVTVRSVRERRNLSYEGVITVGCILNAQRNLAAEPVIEGGGSGFLQSLDWLAVKTQLKEVVSNAVAEFAGSNGEQDLSKLKDALREQANRVIRGRLLVRPLVQVVVQHL